MTNLIPAAEAREWTNRNIENNIKRDKERQIEKIESLILSGKQRINDLLKKGFMDSKIFLEPYSCGITEKYENEFREKVENVFVPSGYNVKFYKLPNINDEEARLLKIYAEVSW